MASFNDVLSSLYNGLFSSTGEAKVPRPSNHIDSYGHVSGSPSYNASDDTFKWPAYDPDTGVAQPNGAISVPYKDYMNDAISGGRLRSNMAVDTNGHMLDYGEDGSSKYLLKNGVVGYAKPYEDNKYLDDRATTNYMVNRWTQPFDKVGVTRSDHIGSPVVVSGGVDYSPDDLMNLFEAYYDASPQPSNAKNDRKQNRINNLQEFFKALLYSKNPNMSDYQKETVDFAKQLKSKNE